MMPKILSTAELEQVYDLFAETIDATPEGMRPLMLTKLALALANLVGDPAKIQAAVAAAARDL
ncbi:MAG: hypothetical protein P4M07_18980 [Xanthobacteraceae bacterium]|nr:hypothetical protein [Xanthobacteraceae bacterium]